MPISLLVRALVVLLCVGGLWVTYTARHSRHVQADVFQQFVKDKDSAKAFERLSDARKLNPESAIEIARARFAEGSRGVALLEKAVETEPENAVLWVRLAQHQRNAGDPETAQRSYARARELDPQLPPKGPPPGD